MHIKEKVIYYSLIPIILISGCVSMDNFYINNVKKRDIQKIEKKYKMIKFKDGINKSEAEIVFQKYVLDYGWPWKMSGGYTRPIDNGDAWIIKYMNCVGKVIEEETWILIDKYTGEIKIKEHR